MAYVISPIYDTMCWIAFSGKVVSTSPPVSMLVIADKQSGKSFTLKQFLSVPAFIELGDATAFGITKNQLPIIHEKHLTHLLAPDFLPMLSRKQETVAGLISFLNLLTWDGLAQMSTYAFPSLPERFLGLRCGLIAGVTRDVFLKNEYVRGSGFLSRFLPLSYTLSADLQKQIRADIRREKNSIKPVHLQLPKTPVKVELPLTKSNGFEERLERLEKNFSIDDANSTGFRSTDFFSKLLKGIALSKGRSVVKEEDLLALEKMAHYFNTDMNLFPREEKKGLGVEKVFHTGGVVE